MSRFYPLKVTAVEKTIRDAVVVTLEPETPEDFAFTQGQYLTFRRDFDGAELRRSYSICAGRGNGILQVGIKRVEGGAFSTWANEALKPGDVLDAMPPMGNFHTGEDKPGAHYLGFAGGSGITPVLSILKTTLEEDPEAEFTLVYANRAVNTIMFREELEDLKNRFMGRLSIIHVLESGAEEMDLFSGRVDAEKVAALFTHWIDATSVDTAFICGPEPMMLAISAALREHGLSEEQIRFELFASAQPGRVKRPSGGGEARSDAPGITAQITLDGGAHTVTMDRETSILDAALENALDAPYACKAGVCSTCRCKVIEGEAEMAANHALEDYEVAQGYVLSCQAFPLTDKIVVDYDQ